MSKTSILIECLNHTQKYTSEKAALRHIAAGRADYDEKRRLVFREIGRMISAQSKRSEERLLGNSSGQEWCGTESGKTGFKVMQLAHLRDRGVRAIQRRLGMEPESKS